MKKEMTCKLLIIKKCKTIICSTVLICSFHLPVFSQCAGIDADAGPDLFTCDPAMMIQLLGSIQGNYSKFFWTPAAGLSNVNVLDPMVTHKNPGRYTFRLTAEGLSNTNLVVNGDFEAGNTGFTSNYTYTNMNVTEGEYFVSPFPALWNGGFSPCTDHTTGSGNMLILNGHPIANTNFWCQTFTTVVGRMYQFEFWSQSLVSANIGQLNVKINGNSVGGAPAGPLCTWVLFTMSFTATSTSTQICLSETTGIRGGNDFAVDDIALYEKCVDTDDVTVEIVNLVARVDIPLKPKCSSDIFDLSGIGSSFGPNIRYEWRTDIGKIISQSGVTAKARGSGIYTLKVIYTNGNTICEQEASIEFNAPDVLIGNLESFGKISCRPDSILLKANMSTGSGLYTYKWSPDSLILRGQNTDSVFVNQARKYSVSITDQSSGCVLVLDMDVRADTTKPSAKITGDTLLDCRSQVARLHSNITDSLRFHILWQKPDSTLIPDKKFITEALSGIYTLLVTDSTNHCTDTARWQVTLDTLKPLVYLGPNTTIDCINQAFSVSNLDSNEITGFSYFWTIDNTTLPKETTADQKFIQNAAEVILRIVNDRNGCQNTDTLLITDLRSIPFLDAGRDTLLTCLHRKLQLNAMVDPKDTLDIGWTSTGGSIISGANQLNPLINAAGWYYIRILNPSNGCENKDSVYVDENTINPLAVLGPDLVFNCNDTIKQIDGSASSQGPAVRYFWSSVNGNILSGLNSPVINVGSPGIYRLIVEDTLNGCRDTASIQILPDLNQPIISILNHDTLNCNNLEIILKANAISRTGNPLSFHWTSATAGTISTPDSLQTKVNSPGLYHFTAVDLSNGCSATTQTLVSLDTLHPIIDAGPDLVWNCSSTRLLFSGRLITNRPSYTYTWSTTNGQIVSSGFALAISVSAPGTYHFFVIDSANGCTAMDSMQVIPDLDKPLIVFSPPDTLNCNTTMVMLDASGSSAAHAFQTLWTTRQGSISGPANVTRISSNASGWYVVTLTDTVNKCKSTDSLFLVQDVQKPFISIATPGELNCNRKNILINATIAYAGSSFQINWSTIGGNIISPSQQASCNVDAAGRYYIRVINLVNGCESIDSVDVVENTNIPVDFHIAITQAKCPGDNASATIVSVTGGIKPYSYFLDNVPVSQPVIQNISPGPHTLKIEDANGCILSKNIFIDQPSGIGVSLPSLVKLNFGEGYTIIPNFTIPIDSIDWIEWTPSHHLSCYDCPQPVIQNLDTETMYTIRYADKNGCIASASIRIQLIKRGIWAPNVFSPNGDNINDWFYPVVAEDSYQIIRSMSIYNRWGEQVFIKINFSPNDPRQGWDGTFNNEKLNPSVFVYIIEVEWKNGDVQIVKGDLSLIR
jgi:gliding motility-associated-like protein